MSFEHVKRILSAEESSPLVSLSTIFSSLLSSVVTLIAKSTTRREKEDEQRKAFCGLMRSAYINMRRFCVNSREKFLLISIPSTLPPHHLTTTIACKPNAQSRADWIFGVKRTFIKRTESKKRGDTFFCCVKLCSWDDIFSYLCHSRMWYRLYILSASLAFLFIRREIKNGKSSFWSVWRWRTFYSRETNMWEEEKKKWDECQAAARPGAWVTKRRNLSILDTISSFNLMDEQ